METTLFWIGCGLGLYALILRQVFKREGLLSRQALVGFLHLFFMVGVGALIGFVFSASMDLQGPNPRWPITGSIIGFLWALGQMLRGSDGPQSLSNLLAADLEWVETTFSAILLAAVIMYCVVQAFKIPSGSMEDTLLIKDHLFVNKFVYGIRIPFTDRRILGMHDVQRRDVVVFEAPETAILSPDERESHVRKDFIKRAIGLPGDRIEIKAKHVYVNGVLQNEPYAVFKDPYTWPAALRLDPARYQQAWESGEFAMHRREEIGDNFGPITVPANCYFVMGDNRDQSFDSRFWGPMPNRLLKGKAWIVYWPLSRIKVIR
ncbi:MAG TPA: signal peptidase I [Elusimicrobiota bacterium]|nr:signal peptidase I [Elusimicrobiota bacterium]